MPLIGFTVFKEEVRQGIKRQTIRRMRAKPFQVGDTLHLYWHLRQKDCEWLKTTTCIEVLDIGMRYYPDFYGMGKPALRVDVYGKTAFRGMTDSELSQLAKLDGFKSVTEMAKWFFEHHADCVQKNLACIPRFQVVRW